MDIFNLSKEVINICVRNEWRLGIVETSTGGYITHLLTSHDGASRALGGTFVLYSAQSKHLVLDIPLDVIQNEGQISEQMIRMMLKSMEKFPIDLIAAATGVAGHSVEGVPRGTTYIGVNVQGKITIRKYKFSGTRQEIKDQCALEMFRLIVEILE